MHHYVTGWPILWHLSPYLQEQRQAILCKHIELSRLYTPESATLVLLGHTRQYICMYSVKHESDGRLHVLEKDTH